MKLPNGAKTMCPASAPRCVARGVSMQVIRIDRPDDPRLATYRNVSDGELLRRRNCFVAEGRLVVGRLLESGHAVESILLNDASFRALQAPLSRVPPDVPIYVCDTQDFTAITGFNLHRGCLALAQRPTERPLADVIGGADLILALEAVSDADNIGSAFRNAAAFGASVVLSDGVLRSAVSQGGSHLDGKRAASAVRACGRLAERSAGIEAQRVHRCGVDASRRRDGAASMRAATSKPADRGARWQRGTWTFGRSRSHGRHARAHPDSR